VLDLQVTVRNLGRTSLALRTVALASGDPRFEADTTLVCIGPAGQPTPWPDAVRNKVTRLTEATA
jgi:4-hydroxybenzoyl-CoA thioesterase